MGLHRCLAAAVCLLMSGATAACGGGRQPPDAQAGTSERPRPVVLASPAAVRVPPPPTEEGAGRHAGRVAEPVSPWIRRALRSVARHTKNPPAASRAYALVSVAAHDAGLAALHWQDEHGERAPGYPSVPAAVAGAASRALAHAFPEEPVQRLEAEAESAADEELRSGRATAAAAAAGLALGRAAAARAIARVRSDRPRRPWRGRPPSGPGAWAPPPGSVARPVAPLAGRWHTWVLPAPDAVRPAPPPRYGSPEYLAAAREVVAVSERLSQEHRRAARFWSGGDATGLPPGIWNQVALEILEQRRLGPMAALRLFAMLNVAMADAGVAVWDAKYAYWTARPVNAIRDLRIADGWRPLLPTPLFPSYPSGHAGYSAAAAEVLAHLFPDQAQLFRDRAAEAAVSRLHGGIHFRFDNEAGARMGREIGRRTVAALAEDGR